MPVGGTYSMGAFGRFRALSAHQVGQCFGRPIADAIGIGTHAGQGRIAQRADGVVVIHPDHTQVVGNGDPQFAAGVERLLAAYVIADEKPGWGLQSGQPLRQGLHVEHAGAFDARQRGFGRALGFIDGEGAVLAGNQFAKGAQPVLGIMRSPVPAECEPAKPPLPQVLEDQSRDGPVIRLHLRDPDVVPAAADIDDRNLQLAQRFDDVVIQPGDDAVRFRFGQPTRQIGVDGHLLVKQ